MVFPDLDAKYLCFTLGFPEDQARQIYETRYGLEPAAVIINFVLLWIGPIPAQLAPPEKITPDASIQEAFAWVQLSMSLIGHEDL